MRHLYGRTFFLPEIFTKSCRKKRREKSEAREMFPVILNVEISISNVFYNRPVVAAATKYVAGNILDVFSAESDFRAQKGEEKCRYPYRISRKTARKIFCIL